MLSGVRSFFYRHRRKFLWSGVIVGGIYMTWRWTRKALREMHDKQIKAIFESTKKKQHHESVERTCNITVLSLLSKVKDNIINLNNTEVLVNELNSGNRSKLEVWTDLKYVAFSKITALVYFSSILVVILRVQLNIIGGYMFKNEPEINAALKEKYLAINEYFLKEGILKLSELIKEKVQTVLKDRSLKEKLSLKEFEQIFWSINTLISNDEANPCNKLTYYTIPTEETDLPIDQAQVYKKILSETCDLLESDEVASITSSNISRGFTFIMDNMTDYFIDRNSNTAVKPSSSNSPDAFFTANIINGGNELINYITIPIAKIIPILSGLVISGESNKDLAYKWIQQLLLMDNLNVLGANIYESFAA